MICYSVFQLTVPMIKNELMHVPPMEKQLEFKSFIMRIDKLKNISGHKKRPPASLPMAKK